MNNDFEKTATELSLEALRPSQLVAEGNLARQSDINFYSRRKMAFVSRTCPGCDGSFVTQFCEKDGFTFQRCSACLSIFMNPGPNQSDVDEFYRQSANYKFWAEKIYPATRERRIQTLHRKRAVALSSWSKKLGLAPKKYLEYGAGTGDTARVFVDSLKTGIEAFAVEPNPDMQGALRRNGISPLDALDGRNDFDIVAAWEVIEHFLAPRQLLIAAHHALRVGGMMMLSTPNASSVEVLALGSQSTTIDVEHISLLTPSAILLLSRSVGFEVLSVDTNGELDHELLEAAGLKLEWNDFRKGSLRREPFSFSNFGVSSNMTIVLRKLEPNKPGSWHGFKTPGS